VGNNIEAHRFLIKNSVSLDKQGKNTLTNTGKIPPWLIWLIGCYSPMVTKIRVTGEDVVTW